MDNQEKEKIIIRMSPDPDEAAAENGIISKLVIDSEGIRLYERKIQALNTKPQFQISSFTFILMFITIVIGTHYLVKYLEKNISDAKTQETLQKASKMHLLGDKIY